MKECKWISKYFKKHYTLIFSLIFFFIVIMGFFHELVVYSKLGVDITSFLSTQDYLLSWIKNKAILIYSIEMILLIVSYQITFCLYCKNSTTEINRIFFTLISILIVGIVVVYLVDIYFYELLKDTESNSDYDPISAWILEKIDRNNSLLIWIINTFNFPSFQEFSFFLFCLILLKSLFVGFFIAITRIKLNKQGRIDKGSMTFIMIFVFSIFFIRFFYFAHQYSESIIITNKGFYKLKKINEKKYNREKYLLIGTTSNYYILFPYNDDNELVKYSTDKDLIPDKLVILNKEVISEITFYPAN